jgi:hypothetical protein
MGVRAAVIGDERCRRSFCELVAVDARGEGERALGDVLRESGDGLGEVVVGPQRALGVREHGLGGEPDARRLELNRWASPEPVARRG